MSRIEVTKSKKLNVIADGRGRLMEILRWDEELFEQFGQAYITTALPNIVKGWHWHKHQTDNICCVSGMVKLVTCNSNYEIEEHCIGEYNPMLVQIPPNLKHGIACIGTKEAIVLNIPNRVYNRSTPDEHRLDAYDSDIGYYDWFDSY